MPLHMHACSYMYACTAMDKRITQTLPWERGIAWSYKMAQNFIDEKISKSSQIIVQNELLSLYYSTPTRYVY